MRLIDTAPAAGSEDDVVSNERGWRARSAIGQTDSTWRGTASAVDRVVVDLSIAGIEADDTIG